MGEEETLLGVKLGISFGLLIASMIAGLIPYLLRLLARVKSCAKISHYIMVILDMLQGFAGGVLLSTGLLHLLVEGFEVVESSVRTLQYQALLDSLGIVNITNPPVNVTVPSPDSIKVYPFGMLCCAIGLVFIVFLEKILEWIVLTTITAKVKKTSPDDQDCENCEKKAPLTEVNLVSQQPSNNTLVIGNIVPGVTITAPEHDLETKGTQLDDISEDDHHDHMHEEHKHDDSNSVTMPSGQRQVPAKVSDAEDTHVGDSHGHSHGDSHHESTHMGDSHHGHSHGENTPHMHVDVDGLKSSNRKLQILSGFILWLSLVSHSIFEGLGVGAAKEDVAALFVAILAHHLIACFALGTVLSEIGLNFFVDLFFLASFSLSVPLGMWIGIGVSSIESVAFELIEGLCLTLASGAFLYVACFEILAHFNPKNGFILFSKMILFIIGFTIMAILAIWS